MAVEFNHTIVWCTDQAASSAFLTDMLGLPAPGRFGPFHVVATANGVNVDFMERTGEIAGQHYAFLISEPEFDRVLERLRERDRPYWADPRQRSEGEINRNDGGRGLYFEDPDGHLLEVLTRPYGSGGE